MGNSLNCSGQSSQIKTDFYVHVRTGDVKGAGTDANVTFCMFDEDDRRSAEQTLDNKFRNDFESGCLDTFTIKNLKKFGEMVTKIEFWRDTAGLADAWYVDRVMVENKKSKNTFIFPVYRWIKPGHHYIIKHLDTALPQFDKDIEEQRKMELEDKRNIYEIAVKAKGLTAQVHATSNEMSSIIRPKKKFLPPFGSFPMEHCRSSL